MLQPLDLLLALKLAVNHEQFTQARLAGELGISASQVNRALKNCANSRLLDKQTMTVRRDALTEFLVHGAKYAFPARIGAMGRGMPTAHSALPLIGRIRSSGAPLVWPDPKGELRGETIEPLHKSAPFASRRDAKLYEALTLLDAIRVGRARERNIASGLLAERVQNDR